MPAGAAEAASFGADAVDALVRIDTDPVLDPAPAAALVERLEALHLAMRAQDARALRRGTGLVGRLLGRDLRVQARARELAERLGVLLVGADRAARALAAHAAAQADAGARIRAACLGLDALVSQVQAWRDGLCAPERSTPLQVALEQRLDHLGRVAAAHGLTARQLELLHEQNAGLLARYNNIRDALLPAWRQRALGEAAAAGSARAADAAAIEAEIGSEVAAMTVTLDARPAPSTLRLPDQENAQ